MTPPAGVLVSDDLLFSSRVTATARAKGVALAVARSGPAATRLASEGWPACVLIDLQNPGLDLPNLVHFFRGGDLAPPRLIAYGSHVDVDALKAARDAGCDRVMPRSRFAAELEDGLAGWFGLARG